MSSGKSSNHVELQVDNQRGPKKNWCNTHNTHPEQPFENLYGTDPYDINFCFPYIPATLHGEGIGVSLVPFIPRIHAEQFFRQAVQHPEDFRYTRFPVPKTLQELLTWVEYSCRRNSDRMAFAILFRNPEGEWIFGGFIMLVSCNPETLSAALALGILFHEFRGKSKAAGPISLILRYCLNTSLDVVPGLGLRRIGWTAEPTNYPSQVVARSFGFRLESVRRWHRVVPQANSKDVRGNGVDLRKGDPLGVPGADELFYVMCWDDWESYGMRLVESNMKRMTRYTPKL